MKTIKNLFKNNYATVVMDGSNPAALSDIIGIHAACMYPNDARISYRAMDNNHPTMMVIESYCSKDTYERIHKLVDEKYAGLCVFNANV